MFTILEEDIEKLLPEIKLVMLALTKREPKGYEQFVTIGEDLPVFRLIGSWVADGIQINIKVIDYNGNLKRLYTL